MPAELLASGNRTGGFLAETETAAPAVAAEVEKTPWEAYTFGFE